MGSAAAEELFHASVRTLGGVGFYRGGLREASFCCTTVTDVSRGVGPLGCIRSPSPRTPPDISTP